MRLSLALLILTSLSITRAEAQIDREILAAKNAMRAATEYYTGTLAKHGGYVYFYTLDLQTRWGEGLASPTQIWIQPPGTPTVGMALLKAYEATREDLYLNAAVAAAEAIAYGQLKSGGWTNSVDFNPKGASALYRNGRGRGKDNSSLDDGQTQSALKFLALADKATGYRNKQIHDAAISGLDALLAAQFPCGAFPQVWTSKPYARPASLKAAGLRGNYPEHDWRTEGRIKEYWTMYTLNDNVAGYVFETLKTAKEVYSDQRYDMAIRRLGDFLIAAQMPEPQPGWAQQYNDSMQPIWARKFEPPGVSGDETQEVIDTLLSIYALTGDDRYLGPIPAALAYLKRSRLPDGRLARYYELKTNRPLYMVRTGKVYELTYDDSSLPKHYGWKTESRIEELEERIRDIKRAPVVLEDESLAELRKAASGIVKALDEQGRWVSKYSNEKLVGQPKFRPGDLYLSSEIFSRNLVRLSEFIARNER